MTRGRGDKNVLLVVAETEGGSTCLFLVCSPLPAPSR